MDKPQANVRANSETTFFEKNRNKFLVATSLIVGATALAGCSTNVEGTAPTHSAEAPAPESTTEPIVEEQPTEQDLIRERIKELKVTPIEEFKQLTRDDRLTHLGGNVLKNAYDEISQQNADGTYISEYNPLKVAAIDNTAESIAHQDEYVLRALFLQRAGDGTTDAFDFEGAQKALSAYQYMGGGDLIVSAEYNATLETLAPLTEVTRITNTFVGQEYAPVKEGVDKDGNAVQYKDVLITDQNGSSFIKRYIFSSFKDGNNEVKNIWQPLATTDVNTPELLDTYM